MVGRNRTRPWSDLPQELLSTIANFLTLTLNCISVTTFRSVCRSWRSSCPRLSNSSLHTPNSYYSLCDNSSLLTPFSYYSLCDYAGGCCSLSVTTICAFYRPLETPSSIEFSSLSPDACILFLDEYTPGKLSIRKPFSTESYNKPMNFPDNINLIDFNVRELGRFYNLSYPTADRSKPRFKDGIDKFIMFPNAPAAINLSDNDTLGMYRFDVLNHKGKVKWVRPETKHDGKGFRFDDIIEFKGRVLGIDRRGRVYEIKYHSSKMTPFVGPIAGGGGRQKRLVESLGLLYLVVRCKVDPQKNDKRTKFKVYELNERRKKWVEISSLGDRTFLFGVNFSFSASARELGPCVKNCIMFYKNCFLSYKWKEDNHIRSSKLEKNELGIGVCHLSDAEQSGAIESYPGYSDSLWPPPSWIWPIDRLKRSGIVETAFDEILDRKNIKLLIERAQNCYGGFLSLVPQKPRTIVELKKVAIGFKEEEIEFMTKLRESMDILNKANNLFEQAKTGSHGSDEMMEERLGWLDKVDNLKTGQAGHDDVLSSAMSMFRKRDALIFNIEEEATEIKMSLKLQR